MKYEVTLTSKKNEVRVIVDTPREAYHIYEEFAQDAGFDRWDSYITFLLTPVVALKDKSLDRTILILQNHSL